MGGTAAHRPSIETESFRILRSRVNTASLVRLGAAAEVRPALVVGMPVGFVDAANAKAALRASRLPAVSNRSAKGGTAAAAVNALRYLEGWA